MYVQVNNIKLIFDTAYGIEPIGAEVQYNMILDDTASGRTRVNHDGPTIKVTDVPDDILSGKTIILNSKTVNVASFTIWDCNRYIHEKIMDSL